MRKNGIDKRKLGFNARHGDVGEVGGGGRDMTSYVAAVWLKVHIKY